MEDGIFEWIHAPEGGDVARLQTGNRQKIIKTGGKIIMEEGGGGGESVENAVMKM